MSDMPVEVQPVHPAVDELNKLAHQLHKQHQDAAAAVLVKKAIHLYPTSPSLWTNLGAFYQSLRQYDEALECHKRSLSLQPEFALAWGNLALTLQSLKRFDEAEAAYTTALLHDPDCHTARWDRSLLFLERGDYVRGWKDYEARRPRAPEIYRELPAPLWDGTQPIRGKSIFVTYEQGMGDQILMMRFLPWLSEECGARVILSLPQLITPLLWEYKRHAEFIPEGVPIPQTDYSLWLSSLPGLFGATLDNLPPDPGYIAERVRKSGSPVSVPMPDLGEMKPFRIGVVWSGNPSMDRNAERTVPLEELIQLADDPRVFLYSMQCGAAARDIQRVGAQDFVLDGSPELTAKGLVATGTAMLQLDLVITSCTVTAHLAGALGVPCWVLVHDLPFFIWGLEGNTTPWWPSVRIFRQQKPSEWRPAISHVRQELTKLLKTNGQSAPADCSSKLDRHTSQSM